MSDQEKGKVRPYRRQRLEPEIAAMSVEKDEDEPPAVVVNIEDNAAKKAIKRVIVWLGVGGFVEWVRRSVPRQVAVAMAGTATVATVATVVVTEMARDNPPARRPGVVAERVVTLPPKPAVTVTVSPTSEPTQARSTRLPRPVRPPTAAMVAATERPFRSASPTARPARTKSATPARRPTRRATQAPALAATKAASMPAETAADPPIPSQPEDSGPPPTPDPPAPEETPVSEPTLAAAECDGVVRVDLNPLLDLCLLG